MNNVAFVKTMKNLRKDRDSKLVTTERRRNSLVSEPNFNTTNFSQKLLAIEMEKTEILMNKLVYLGLSILKLHKILIYEFWYDYVKPKYCEKAKLFSLDADSFIVYIQKQMIFIEILQKMLKQVLILQIMN